MESGDGARVKTANTPALVGFDPSALGGIDPRSSGLFNNPSSDGLDPQGGSASLCCSVLIIVNRGGVLMDLNVTRIIKIIQFPENIDKLTSYFDKYLKSGREEIT